MNQRTVFGFARTECVCAECVLNCQHMPGYLIPEDLPAIAAALGYDDWDKFALESLAASSGATVLTDKGMMQIPTLVPQRQANGACKFLDENQRCRLHAVSPFGCSFFDCTQSKAEADGRSAQGLQAIVSDLLMRGMYAHLWLLLDTHGLHAVPALEAKARIRAAHAAQEVE